MIAAAAAARARLREIGAQADQAIDLAEAALALAWLDRPRVEPERYRHHLALLARDVAAAAAAEDEDEDEDEDDDPAAGRLDRRVAALNGVILGKYGYAGDSQTYEDPQNANLMRVIDRRKGLPVALGIVYLHAARAQGWEAHGLGFVQRVVAGEDLDAAAREWAELLAARDPAALRAMKRAVLDGLDRPLAAGLALERRLAAAVAGA